MATTDVDIAVIGGGIGGLTLALALRQRGLEAEVFEQADALREVGAAVAIAANGSRILQRLGLGDQLAAAAVVPTALQYRHWRSGTVVADHPVGDAYARRFGAPFWGIHRASLQRTLSEAWDVERLHLGRCLAGVSDRADGVLLTFRDGRTVNARTVIGADGVHSQVRRHIDASVPVYSGTSGFRGMVPTDALPSLPSPSAVQFWMGPGGHVLHYAVGESVNFLAVLDGPERWPHQAGHVDAGQGELNAAFADWHPVVRELLGAVPQSPRWGLFTLPSPLHWSRGRSVLLGDAAHAMLPHHGQGANLTIEDAAVLARCIADAGPEGYESAFGRYERLRRPRARAVQRASWDTSEALHLPDGPTADIRDERLRTLDGWLGWIHGHDPESHPASVPPLADAHP
ncbi:FAD-dependent monooxygenase [Pseudonocardia sp. KRD-184]|uniref:FAD-dependent monooxygenase n=2 Tax=Pseudonocardia oceani TaxID=2792013 RepID=A0ABS6UDA1_9PSEU|nr:FAD-dependent monooxygenase [Pseudonocardia oceani]MBW0095782.1 FAD-dependent monooxygenase [Pseudonocardia oceani]MBW0108341.1 FAD-dependent monooxygenase [Pseudonocardia oceani]MBW0120183.1 FAD-dependent monooxygenase [Pseudonocardia oceani]MBW0130227.1 FAD-dependent monooxygenase [Pseudonocardia oceani]